MKDNTYTVKFFKDLINKSTLPVEVKRGSKEQELKNKEDQDFLTYLFSPHAQ